MNSKLIGFTKLDERQIPIWYKTGLQSIVILLFFLIFGAIIKYSTIISTQYTFIDICLLSFSIGFSYFFMVLAFRNVLFRESKVNILHCIALTLFSIIYILIIFNWNSEVFKDSSKIYHFNIFTLAGAILIVATTISMWVTYYSNLSYIMNKH